VSPRDTHDPSVDCILLDFLRSCRYSLLRWAAMRLPQPMGVGPISLRATTRALAPKLVAPRCFGAVGITVPAASAGNDPDHVALAMAHDFRGRYEWWSAPDRVGCQEMSVRPMPSGDFWVKHSRKSRSTTSWVSISSRDGADSTIVPGCHPCPQEISPRTSAVIGMVRTWR
jgi:hypothetical protein